MRMTRSGRKCTARALWALSLALLFVAGICIPAHAADLQAAFGEEDAPAVELDARISHLAAMDLDTGALLLAQDADEPFAPTGGAVTMMTTYLAAQALTPEATVAMDGGEARAADLVAAAILDGDQDSASALAQAIGEDAVSRMNDAALALGMTATTYVSPAGTPEEGQRTTCTDLLRLGRALVESETFADVFSCAVWETASPDSSLPAQIENRVQMLNPDSEFYDARVLSAFGGGSGAELFNTVILAQAGEQRVLVACAAQADEEETYALLSQALNALEAGYFRADVTEQARAALDLVANSADGIALTYTLNAPLLVSARTGWTLQENALRIELQNVREEILAGEAYADAVVLLDGREIARTLLTAQAVEAPPEETPAPEFAETPEPDYAEPSVAPEDLYQPTTYDRYGWALWTLAGVLGAAAVLVVLGLIDRKIS